MRMGSSGDPPDPVARQRTGSVAVVIAIGRTEGQTRRTAVAAAARTGRLPAPLPGGPDSPS